MPRLNPAWVRKECRGKTARTNWPATSAFASARGSALVSFTIHGSLRQNAGCGKARLPQGSAPHTPIAVVGFEPISGRGRRTAYNGNEEPQKFVPRWPLMSLKAPSGGVSRMS